MSFVGALASLVTLGVGCSADAGEDEGDGTEAAESALGGPASRPQYRPRGLPSCRAGFDLQTAYSQLEEEEDGDTHFASFVKARYFPTVPEPASLLAPKAATASAVLGMRLIVKNTKPGTSNFAYVASNDWCYDASVGRIFLRPQGNVGRAPHGKAPSVGAVRQAFAGESQVPIAQWGGWRELTSSDGIEVDYVVGPNVTCDGNVAVGACDFGSWQGARNVDGKGICFRPLGDSSLTSANSQWKKIEVDKNFPGHSIMNQCSNF
jgi:hypothetical protein